ncbi:MAG: hypothetical protein NC402_07560 [Prevotella sp.]|nr:hypothetical protein [Prevotella sp.]MCM1075594.1 hypothetical protein [Ruminococcus sp.]
MIGTAGYAQLLYVSKFCTYYVRYFMVPMVGFAVRMQLPYGGKCVPLGLVIY